jgi:hypothetical protein
MPEVSRFLGIVIAMFYREHEPAHFHAIYGEHEITVARGFFFSPVSREFRAAYAYLANEEIAEPCDGPNEEERGQPPAAIAAQWRAPRHRSALRWMKE